MPKFSIITISYNSSKTISRTIESVLNQTFDDYEYIIVDGASKDCTIDIIKSYEERFKGKLKWSSEPDGGIYPAMNKGIRKAEGDIIGIVNSDDWLEPDALETVFKYVENTNEQDRYRSVYCGAIKFHYSDSEQVFPVNRKIFEKNIKRMSLKGVWHPGTYVPKSVYDKFGLFDERFKIIGDVDFVYRIYMGGIDFVLIPNVLTNMADGGASNSGNFYMNDRKYMLSKHGYSGVRYYILLFQSITKECIRRMLPMKLMRWYRSYYA